MYCPSPKQHRGARWSPFAAGEKHIRDGTGDGAWKLVSDDREGLIPYSELADELARRLQHLPEVDIFHYYAIHGSKDADAHFASLIEFKEVTTGKAVLLLRLEYNVSKLMIGREPRKNSSDTRNVTILTAHDGKECVHTGNDDGQREAFPNVVYYSGVEDSEVNFQLPRNHRFANAPVRMSRAGARRLIRECLRDASIPDEGYTHLPDIVREQPSNSQAQRPRPCARAT